jgi:transposase IS204/IS1001/IS1096/IS1165 family protein
VAPPRLAGCLAPTRTPAELATRMAPAVLSPTLTSRLKTEQMMPKRLVQRSLSLLFSQESVLPLSQGDVFLSCPGWVDLGVVLPHLAGVIVEEIAVAAGLLLVLARARAATAACPKCGTEPGRVHSRYERRLAGAAIGGRQVEIHLEVRRFFCPASCCRRRTFAEQADGLTTRYARKTPLLDGVPGRIAVALAGRAGSRKGRTPAAPQARLAHHTQLNAARTYTKLGPDPRSDRTSGAGVVSHPATS